MLPNSARLSTRFSDEGCDAAEVGVREDVGPEGGVEVVGGQAAEVLAVEPAELGEIEDGAAEGDLLEAEVGEHVGEREEVGSSWC